ncbi:hypothetical protein QFC21_006350 [Naganishia friedmannii]|uniref:Uncharacterized protein n=1 Tax=Naganishia friedmannii TaxID=89922 RepID=A0ACC2V2P7_9TREE|nr:hypothetical protein QFC21_006350 [Naganishia friedmannii]
MPYTDTLTAATKKDDNSVADNASSGSSNFKNPQQSSSSHEEQAGTKPMKLRNVLLTIPVSRSSLDALKQKFEKVVYCLAPSANSSKEDSEQEHGAAIQQGLPAADVLITSARHLALLPQHPQHRQSETLKNLRLIQLASAGVDTALDTGWMKALVQGGRVVGNQTEWLERQQRREAKEKEGAEGSF